VFLKANLLFTTSRPVRKSMPSPDMTKMKMGWGGLKGGTNFSIKKSYDESKIMVHYNLKPLSKKDAINKDEVGIYVFDNTMNKVWGNEVRMPKTEKEINNISYTITSSGVAKLLIANRVTKTYQMYTVDNTGSLSEKDLGITTEKMIRDLQLEEDSKGNFIGLGFYANGLEFKIGVFSGPALVYNANGLIYFEMSQNDDVTNIKTYDFSKEFIMQNLSDGQKKKVAKREADGKAGILDLVMRDIKFQADGSILIAGEVQYMRREMYGTQQQNVYHFSNMVMMKLKENRDLAWIKKLPKNQAGIQGVGQMSYSYLQGGESDYLAFVDNPKNINLNSSGGVPKSHKDGFGGFLTTYKVNKTTGDLEKHTLLDLKKMPKGYAAYQFKTSRIMEVGDGVFLMEVYIKGKKE
jgi:hypothetical protein